MTDYIITNIETGGIVAHPLDAVVKVFHSAQEAIDYIEKKCLDKEKYMLEEVK